MRKRSKGAGGLLSLTMSESDQLQYQARAFLELTHIIQTQKIPNSLLFYGNENTKRKKAAFFFAKGCNCLKKRDIPCNDCKSCRKIDGKTHPDILIIDLEKEKKIVSISQIRKMGLAIASKPNEARFRMVLILNADKMNPQAQNALLKMLEEPPGKTFFILIAHLEAVHARQHHIEDHRLILSRDRLLQALAAGMPRRHIRNRAVRGNRGSTRTASGRHR